MSDCGAVRENMPLLLSESLDSSARELSHQHIETCAACEEEWILSFDRLRPYLTPAALEQVRALQAERPRG